jgi:hypothetical protein
MEDPSMDRAFGGWKNFVLFLERASWFFFFLRSWLIDLWITWVGFKIYFLGSFSWDILGREGDGDRETRVEKEGGREQMGGIARATGVERESLSRERGVFFIERERGR